VREGEEVLAVGVVGPTARSAAAGEDGGVALAGTADLTTGTAAAGHWCCRGCGGYGGCGGRRLLLLLGGRACSLLLLLGGRAWWLLLRLW